LTAELTAPTTILNKRCAGRELYPERKRGGGSYTDRTAGLSPNEKNANSGDC